MVKTSSLQHFAFLAEASSIMNSSLDYQTHLPVIAELAVVHLSEWCLIDLVDCDLHFNQLIVAHKDNKKTKVELKKRNSPVRLDSQHGISKTVKSRSSQVIVGEKEDILNKISLGEEPFDFADNLEVKSAAIIPLIADTEILGALTFLSDREIIFSDIELCVAEDFAKRISKAIENGKLYEKAIKANKSKSAFLANMSHEIRTPLAAMLGFADLLSEAEDLKKEHLSSLETITRNGKQLLKIVNEILDLSKVESDRMSIEEVDFSIDDLIRDLSSLFSLQAQRKGIDFKISKKEGSHIPGVVISDPTRIRQILVNIIGNAFKFTERGEVVLEISCDESSPDRTFFSFIIKDTGIGLTPEQQKKLFQPFAQAEPSTALRFGGTGLGLFYSKRLARTLGGDLQLLESQYEKGSSFLFTIPAKKVAPEERITPYSFEAPRGPVELVDLHSLKVLVVDDSMDGRELISRFISKAGAQVEVASDGSEGIKKALSDSYDLIFMDVQMPGIDGFEATYQLRSRKYTKPIVALTAHAMKGDRERCLRGGFDDHIAKPIDKEALYQTMAKFVTVH